MIVKRIIKPQKKKEGFTLILAEDTGVETEITVSPEVYFKRPFKEGYETDLQDIEELINDDYRVKGRETALSMLDRGLKSRKEIEKRLISDGIPEKLTEGILDSLEGYGYVDDRRLSEAFIDSKIGSRGKLKIRYDLIKKGIDSETIDGSFSEEDSQKELNGLYIHAEKKYTSLKAREKDRRKIYEKLMRFLMSKGYSYDDVKNTAQKVMGNDTYNDFESNF